MEYEQVVPIGITLFVHFLEHSDTTVNENKFTIEND